MILTKVATINIGGNFNIGCKWRDDFKSGLKIYIGQHSTPFLPKKRSKTRFCQFSPFFGQNGGSNVPRFKFWDQIWNRRRHLQPIWPVFVEIIKFRFLVPIVIKKKSNGPCGRFFSEFEISDVRFGISVPKDIKMGGVTIALPKKWCLQPVLT